MLRVMEEMSFKWTGLLMLFLAYGKSAGRERNSKMFELGLKT